jgi:hypothetical protein
MVRIGQRWSLAGQHWTVYIVTDSTWYTLVGSGQGSVEKE